MKKLHRAVDRIDRLVNTLSEMAAPFGYRIVVVSDLWHINLCIGLCLFDEKKTKVATLCVAPLEDSEELSAKALLLKYESKNSWTAFFYKGYDGLTFPGGSLEEIELKVAVGVKARLDPDINSPENLLADL